MQTGAPVMNDPPDVDKIPGASLSDRTALGAAWLIGQTIALKLFGFVSQMVLAWLLLKKDFGLAALAQSTALFGGILQQVGLREVLIHRQARFRRWANIAFWMSLASGLASGVIILLCAPVASRIYGAPLTGLMVILALYAPIQSLSIVPIAALQNALQFRKVATIGLYGGIANSALSILFASRLFSLGAYSFVLPLPIVGAVMAGIFWIQAKPPIRWRPQFSRWHFLLADTSMLFGINALSLLITQGDYMAIGLFHNESAVGLYYFAFGLSSKTIVILTNNLASAIFPVLSKLQEDPVRQTAAFLRAMRMLALVGVPACLAQATLAEPLMRLLFKPEWWPATRVLQILSIAMIFDLMGVPSGALFQSQGRFRALFFWCLGSSLFFIALVGFSAWCGSISSVALAVLFYFIVCGPLQIYWAIKPGGGDWQGVLSLYWPALAAGALAFAPSAALASIAATSLPHMWRIILVVVPGCAVYLLLIRAMVPDQYNELTQYARKLVPRMRRLPLVHWEHTPHVEENAS